MTVTAIDDVRDTRRIEVRLDRTCVVCLQRCFAPLLETTANSARREGIKAALRVARDLPAGEFALVACR
jgi:tRNA U54 and U55 pseudouridine synthase Pus10